MPRQMKKGGTVNVPTMMAVPKAGWGDFINDLKGFDFNTAKKWLGLKKGGKVKKAPAKKKATKKK